VPELPDITVYIDCLRPRVIGHVLNRLIIKAPFLLRTFDPPIDAIEGRAITGVERLGKRVVFAFDNDCFAVLHLMIAGRLLWKPAKTLPKGKIDLAAIQFEHGTLLLTEASPKHRAALHVLRGREALLAHSRGGVEPLDGSLAEFAAAIRRENHTLKRTLTSQRTFSGIGNAYSDEILHAARLSPLKHSQSMKDEEIERLQKATQKTLENWTTRLREEFDLDKHPDTGGRFPSVREITAFRPDFAVHGKFGKPCPVCGSPVQRIVHAENETNYCATCQTGGKVLADRSLSRLLKGDWPRTIEEWEGEFGGG
jgi:formamidopyrimidine-DNA glycosylase